MKAPKVPQHTLINANITSQRLHDAHKDSIEDIKHFHDLNEWYAWVTSEIERLTKENTELKRKLKELETK